MTIPKKKKTLTWWEAHKCVICGEFLRTTSKLKKEKQTKINSLLTHIQKLEASHKLNMSPSTYEELVHIFSYWRN